MTWGKSSGDRNLFGLRSAEAEVADLRSRLEGVERERDQLQTKTRNAFCIYCGFTFEYQPNQEKSREAMQEAHNKLLAHDAECPRNPLVKRLKELERERNEALEKVRNAALTAMVREDEAANLEARIKELEQHIAEQREAINHNAAVHAEYVEAAGNHQRTLHARLQQLREALGLAERDDLPAAYRLSLVVQVIEAALSPTPPRETECPGKPEPFLGKAFADAEKAVEALPPLFRKESNG